MSWLPPSIAALPWGTVWRMFPCRPMVRDRVGGGMATDRTISRASLIRWLFPFVLAALALLALERTFGPGAPNVPRAPAPPPIFVGGPKSYEEALSRIDASLAGARRSEEHTSDLQSLIRISYAVLCLKKKNKTTHQHTTL